jgi:uncharacterized membrane protein (UPF0182 family)
VVIFLALISISTIVTLYADLLWFREIGFQQVFWRILSSKALLVGVFFAVFFVLSFVNLLVVRRSIPAYRMPADEDDPMARLREAFIPLSRWIPLGASAVLALLFSLRMAPVWDRFILAANQVPFGSVDPIFNRDIGFFVFRLPMYEVIYGWLFSALVVITLMVSATYYIVGAIRPQASINRVSPQVKVHLSVLIGLLALLRAWGYRLDQFELLYSPRGVVEGASFTDVNAELPALKLLVAISIISAVLFLVNIRFRGWTLPLIGVGLWLLTSILAAGLFPFIVQRFRVEPAELQRERPFIQRNIEATRTGFGLDAMQVREFPIEPGLQAASVEGNRTALDNVRLWDPQTLKTAYRQLQEIRTYYQFQDVDVDRYDLDGGRRQLMLALRELDTGGLESRTWQNDHLVFTHGYGAVASPTNATAGGEGRPQLLLRDIPPVSEQDALKIDQPGVYFGEGPSTYSIVKTEQPELDYTALGQNKTTTYSGRAGVPVGGFIRRLAFAWNFRDVNLAISGLIDSESEIIYNRQVRQRVAKAAPFLEFDGDPYAVIAGGRILWMLDAYTVSNMYPYSQSIDFETRTRVRGGALSGAPSIVGMNNYVRNSVKATVDAYDGTIKLYVWDTQDPIITSWRQVFPSLFEDASEMPAEVRSHVRYPEDLFRVQTTVYQRYHMTDPTNFYQREDEWVIPANPERGSSATAPAELEPYYVLMRLPDSNEEEYVLILPMNPRNKPNMISLLAAKSDPEQFGELVDLRFPTGLQIDGVGQIHSRINANEEISRTITLLDDRGSSVILGNLLVIPVGNQLLYSQPLFLQADQEAIPELKYVILATSDRVLMAPTLEESLQGILRGGPVVVPDEEDAPAPTPTPTPTASPSPAASPAPGPAGQTREQLLREAQQSLEASEAAARNGDWATYGRELEEAKDVLRRALEAPAG